MDLADVQAHIQAMALRGFVLRRSTTAFSAFGNVYEFRSVNGGKWYPILRLNMLFPKLDPDVGAYVRQLFDRLNHGEEVTVQGEYTQHHMHGKLFIVPEGGTSREESGSRQAVSNSQGNGNGPTGISPPAASGPALFWLQNQLSRLTESARQCLEA